MSNAALMLHVAAGGVALVAGFAALAFRKGARWHQMAGSVLFISMLIMSVIGAGVAIFRPAWIATLAGVLTFYLVATAWMTVRRKAGVIGGFEIGAAVFGGATVIGGAVLGMVGANSPNGELNGLPYQVAIIFMAVAALAVAGDFRLIVRRGISGAPRIARHLWRMSAALLIASFSFFLGRTFPEPISDSLVLYVPEAVVVAVMVYWLVRLRFPNALASLRAQGQPLAASPGTPGHNGTHQSAIGL